MPLSAVDKVRVPVAQRASFLHFYHTGLAGARFTNFSETPFQSDAANVEVMIKGTLKTITIDAYNVDFLEKAFQAESLKLNRSAHARVMAAKTARQVFEVVHPPADPRTAPKRDHDWDDRNVVVMAHLQIAKFKDRDLCAFLLRTGDSVLVEDSPHDAYWGCGSDGKGWNILGLLLTALRDFIKVNDRAPSTEELYELHEKYLDNFRNSAGRQPHRKGTKVYLHEYGKPNDERQDWKPRDAEGREVTPRPRGPGGAADAPREGRRGAPRKRKPPPKLSDASRGAGGIGDLSDLIRDLDDPSYTTGRRRQSDSEDERGAGGRSRRKLSTGTPSEDEAASARPHRDRTPFRDATPPRSARDTATGPGMRRVAGMTAPGLDTDFTSRTAIANARACVAVMQNPRSPTARVLQAAHGVDRTPSEPASAKVDWDNAQAQALVSWGQNRGDGSSVKLVADGVEITGNVKNSVAYVTAAIFICTLLDIKDGDLPTLDASNNVSNSQLALQQLLADKLQGQAITFTGSTDERATLAHAFDTIAGCLPDKLPAPSVGLGAGR